MLRLARRGTGLRARRLVDDVDEEIRRVVFVANQRAVHHQVAVLPPAVDHPLLDAVAAAVAAQQLLRQRRFAPHILGEGDVLEREAFELLARVSRQLPEPLVEEEEVTVGRGTGNPGRRRLEHRPQARAGIALRPPPRRPRFPDQRDDRLHDRELDHVFTLSRAPARDLAAIARLMEPEAS
jgi:hypothetical protein